MEAERIMPVSKNQGILHRDMELCLTGLSYQVHIASCNGDQTCSILQVQQSSKLPAAPLSVTAFCGTASPKGRDRERFAP